jgi:NDP-sugar pyrophosphorylase family protein
MKYAIIAAGKGSRLREEGINLPKPLVELNGEKLIDRLIRIFIDNGATEIIVICNDIYPEVNNHLTSLEQQGLPLRHIVKTTESSMHSLHEMAPLLQGDRFILTTVDTVFSERMFSRFVEAFSKSDAYGMIALTDYCDY